MSFIGSEQSPFLQNIDIILPASGTIKSTLTNISRSAYTITYVSQSGLDLHGSAHNITWTRIADTVQAGNYSITLEESVDWQIGDEFVITTTDTSISHTERHRIAGIVNNRLIRTTKPLSYTHQVIRRSFPNGSSVYIAAAVGLLTRNIRIISTGVQSDRASVKISIVNTSSIYRPNIFHVSLSNVQFIGIGQFSDSSSEIEKSGIFISNINVSMSAWPTYIRGCSFDGGFNIA